MAGTAQHAYGALQIVTTAYLILGKQLVLDACCTQRPLQKRGPFLDILIYIRLKLDLKQQKAALVCEHSKVRHVVTGLAIQVIVNA